MCLTLYVAQTVAEYFTATSTFYFQFKKAVLPPPFTIRPKNNLHKGKFLIRDTCIIVHKKGNFFYNFP